MKNNVQDQAPGLTEELEAWISENGDEQDARYQKIVAAMEALGETRDEWIVAFLERIQTRGFNFDGDRLRKISSAEIPARPDRPGPVVF